MVPNCLRNFDSFIGTSTQDTSVFQKLGYAICRNRLGERSGDDPERLPYVRGNWDSIPADPSVELLCHSPDSPVFILKMYVYIHSLTRCQTFATTPLLLLLSSCEWGFSLVGTDTMSVPLVGFPTSGSTAARAAAPASGWRHSRPMGQTAPP